MLNFVYWPISAVMWFWREVLSFVLDPDSGVTWVLSIILLTFTIKGLLVYPTVRQLRSSRKMQQLAPQMQAIRAKYKHDQAKMAEETQKLYKDAKMNPITGCLPVLVQLPVFLGLFHVLRSFNRVGDDYGGLGMTVEENRNTANYMFSPEDVQSFLDARFFGVPLSASIAMPQDQYYAFPGAEFTRLDIILVAVPMILLIAIMTHFNARVMLNRQKARLASGKQAAPTGDNAEMMQMQQDMMGKMMLWFMPLVTIGTGFIWTIGLLVYMTSNTLWTFFQQRIVFNRMDAEEEAEEEERRELAKATAPKVGARPDRRAKTERREENTGSTAASGTPELALPPVHEDDADFNYLTNAERKALRPDDKADYDRARAAFEKRNPEIAAAAAEAGRRGQPKQSVLDQARKVNE